MIGHFLRNTILASACAAAVVTSAEIASARTAYDGSWSVLIITSRGACDATYRYGIQIINGRVVYEGGAVNFTGRVQADGSVSVAVRAGSQHANGSGKLSRNAGRGVWRGAGNT